MSILGNGKLAINTFTPLALGSKKFLSSYRRQVSDYSHTISALGGYDNASFAIFASPQEILAWLGALGRHIEVKSEKLTIVWEGYINQITVTLGPFEYTLGPLRDIGNRVRVLYSTVDTSTDPPTTGVRVSTASTNDTDSQNKYGILERVQSLGGATSDIALQVRGKVLEEYKTPSTSRQSNLSGDNQPSVTVECLGYWHWLNNYYYNNTSTGTQSINAKIQAVLGAEPNGTIFSSDYTKIDDPTAEDVGTQENKNRTAATVIKQLVSLGDASANRYTAGFYAGQRFVYTNAPTTYAYKQKIFRNPDLLRRVQRQIDPYEVTPAEWIFYPDLLIGQRPPVNLSLLQSDIRAGFIENVEYTAPNDLSVNGVKVNTLNQFLARVGLGQDGV